MHIPVYIYVGLSVSNYVRSSVPRYSDDAIVVKWKVNSSPDRCTQMPLNAVNVYFKKRCSIDFLFEYLKGQMFYGLMFPLGKVVFSLLPVSRSIWERREASSMSRTQVIQLFPPSVIDNHVLFLLVIKKLFSASLISSATMSSMILSKMCLSVRVYAERSETQAKLNKNSQHKFKQNNTCI